MLRMYEIKEELRNIVDEETGEILDETRFDALIQEERDIEMLALFCKETKAEIETIENEIAKLQARKNGAEQRNGALREYLKYRLAGEKFKTPLVSVFYKKSESVEQLSNDIYFYPKEYLRYKEPELNKTKAKEDLKAGMLIDGLKLKESISMVIR